jgi:uncharacterized protein involved in exopolysaccharide biosynthesis
MLTSTFVVIGGIPDSYQSSGSVVVAGNREDRQALAARVATLIERINSRGFLEPIIERFNLYPSKANTGQMEAAVNSMRRDIKVETKYRNETPETVMITYRNPDPSLARDVTSELVSVFGEMNKAVEEETDRRSAQIATEIENIDTRLRQLGERNVVTAARNRATSIGRSAGNALASQRIAAASSVEELSDKQYGLEQQVAEQKRQIAEQEKIARSASGDAKSGSSYGVLLVRKAELEAQMKEYETQYTDKNPKVVQSRTQLSEINKQLAQLTAASGQEGAIANSAEARELRSMQRELARMETELEINKRVTARKQAVAGNATAAPAPAASFRPSSPAPDQPLANISFETDKDRLKERYNVLLRQQDEIAQLRHSAAGLDPGLFQLVAAPALPQVPAGPDRWKLRLFGLALALGVALLVIAIVEGPKLFSIHDDRDIRYYLGAPVLALLPETLTPDERGRARRLLVAKSLGVFVLGAILIPVLAFVLKEFALFQMIAGRW